MPLLGEGQTFERYQIIQGLGSGVAGESYEAEDRVLQRRVMLKLIHPWSALPDSARRQFFREMQGISALSHPHLATLLDYGECEGRLYVVRRYITHGSLLGSSGRTWFRPPLAVTDAFKYAHQLAYILQYIHQHGYVHGALTFANVLVMRGPAAGPEQDYAPFLLADIGLAHFTRRFGAPLISTLPVSAAPEQIGKRVVPASDQFALAVLLYFWLAGRPPYLGAPGEVEQLKLTERMPLLSTLNPGVTGAQDTIIARALKAHPEERYPSVLAFSEALQTTLRVPTQAPNTPASLFSEQPETPRPNLSKPLPTLRKMPTLRPAGEDTEEISRQSGPHNGTPHAQAGTATASATLAQMSPPETPQPVEIASAPVPATPQSIEVSPPPVPVTSQLIDLTPVDGTSVVSTPASSPQAEAVTQQDITREQAEQHAPASHEVEASTPEPVASVPEQEAPASDVSESTETILTGTDAESESSDQPVEPGQDEPASERATAVPCLIITSPYTDSPSEFLLLNEATNVGRASANDLRLDEDNLTSRYHALFKRAEQHVFVFDKHSNNGVFVNGQRIEAAQDCELVDGDHISIGSYELIYRAAHAERMSQLI